MAVPAVLPAAFATLPSRRAARLHEVATRALTETLAAGCSGDEFVHGFAGVDEEETRLLLLNMREQTQAALRDNVLVRAGGVHASHAIHAIVTMPMYVCKLVMLLMDAYDSK